MTRRLPLHALIISSLALGVVGLDSGCVAPPQKDGAKGEDKAGGGFVTHEDIKDDKTDKIVKGERFRLTFEEGDLYFGAANPKVTIVEYSDVQCPYCKRLTDTMHKVLEAYPDDVRIVFKQFPLRMHKSAKPAAIAMLAGHAQGKGREMHDILFENNKALSEDEIYSYAEKVGVQDMDKFKADFKSEDLGKKVDAEMKQGMNFAVRSTPSFFVNGKPMRGAVAFDKIKTLIDEEIKVADKMIEAGAAPNEIYARIMKVAKEKREAPPRPDRQKKQAGRPEPDKNYAVPVADRQELTQYGNPEALVTIVEFSDFQCPFCSRVLPTIKEIKEKYPDDVRIVFLQQPLPMHKDAPGAARASLAAAKQGKFWEMHDKLFANAKSLNEEKFVELAGELQLDVDKFKKDLKDKALDAMVKEDQKIAQQFGANGTPAFFVNGRFISGAQKFDAFEKLIEEEKKKAEKFMKEKKVKPEELYDKMIEGWEKEVKIPPPPPPADFKRRDVSTKGLPGKGNLKNPKITIVECSDYDCPFCKRAEGTIAQVLEGYGDKVAFYFRNYPLPMHKNAEPAHRAGVAIRKQSEDAFWKAHEKLFNDKSKRSEADFVAMVEELGLDVAKFKDDWAAEATAQEVKDDIAACQKLNVRGAPGFLINGRLMSGAQPFPRFKEVLEEELNGGFEATQKKKKEEEAKKGKGDKKEGAKDGAKDDKKAPAKGDKPKKEG